jgi:hypothetical protein
MCVRVCTVCARARQMRVDGHAHARARQPLCVGGGVALCARAWVHACVPRGRPGGNL